MGRECPIQSTSSKVWFLTLLVFQRAIPWRRLLQSSASNGRSGSRKSADFRGPGRVGARIACVHRTSSRGRRLQPKVLIELNHGPVKISESKAAAGSDWHYQALPECSGQRRCFFKCPSRRNSRRGHPSTSSPSTTPSARKRPSSVPATRPFKRMAANLVESDTCRGH